MIPRSIKSLNSSTSCRTSSGCWIFVTRNMWIAHRVLVKVTVDSKSRAEVMQITDIFRAKIVDVQPKSLTIEITGNDSKVEKFLDLMKTFGVLELTRTGQVA